MASRSIHLILLAALVLLLSSSLDATAKPPIRSDFFALYPSTELSQLDDLPSSTRHCGLCHFDFDGGGPRNPYGLGIEVGRNNGLSTDDAMLAIESTDSDNDGFTNLVEILSTLYDNTPTFPGLSESNKGDISNIPPSEVDPYITPAGGSDTTPPAVTLSYPGGGQAFVAGETVDVLYTADDANGISHVNVYMSEDSGASWKPVALNQPPSGTFPWFVPNLPGAATRIKVEAFDNAANPGSDEGADFSVAPQLGLAPTTLRDMDMPSTQPLTGVVVDDPGESCVTCHGGYDFDAEPWHGWQGSMMAQAQRDPLYLACLTVAEQDAPSVGDLCIRCHSPGGWMEGRSVDTSGNMLNEKDRQGVHCDFCHRLVDFDYVEGVSPPQDSAVLSALDEAPANYANGDFIADPDPLRRGPRADAQPDHAFAESPFHREADICGTCHDVSNPVFVRNPDGTYSPAPFDSEHPDKDLRNMFPIERTFSEWSASEYATTGVYAPQFAGTKLDGIVSTCQDCHMADVAGKAAAGGPNRGDLAFHDLTGGNTFVPEILPDFAPGEVDAAELADGVARARTMLGLAATLELTPTNFGVTVRVTNETGHKLPSGYPEGRRIWLHVVGKDQGDNVVFTSGQWDPATGELEHQPHTKIYHIEPGLSEGLAGALGLPSGPSFHFVLNDMVYLDNRIPPRGFTNAGFEAIQSSPVGHVFADGQYWDDTDYTLPGTATWVEVSLYYQTTSKEYVEFLRDENVTDTRGQELYQAWVGQGMNPPELMAYAEGPLDITGTGVTPSGLPTVVGMSQGAPNPFQGRTDVAFWLPEQARVRINVYDLRGRRVRTLVNQTYEPGRYSTAWDGRDERGRTLASGVYLMRLEAGPEIRIRRVTLLR